MRVSFEEACKISHDCVSAEKMKLFGVDSCMTMSRDLLAKAGWTLKQLCDESARRQKVLIFRLYCRKIICGEEHG